MALGRDKLGWIEYRNKAGKIVHRRLGYVSELETDDLGDMGSWFSKVFKPILSPLNKIVGKPLTTFYQRAIKPSVKMLVPTGAPPATADTPPVEEHPVSTEAPIIEAPSKDYTMYYVAGGVAVAGLLTVLLLTGKKKGGKK